MNRTTLSALALVLHSLPASADCPIISNHYLADPPILVTKDRVCADCSNADESPVEGGYNIPNPVCISSSDMKNWTDHGIVFDAARNTKWAKKAWVTCTAERDGNTYLKREGVPYVWHVDGHGHDDTHRSHALWPFAQSIFR